MTNFEQSSPFFGTNATFVEELYQRYMQDPNSVDESWQSVFSSMGDTLEGLLKDSQGASWSPKASRVIGVRAVDEEKSKKTKPGDPKALAKACQDSINALMLIRAFKVRGGLLADLDPLGLEGRIAHPDLDPATYGFTEDDFDRDIYIGGALGLEKATLHELLGVLKQTYASKIGVEFMHMPEL